MTTNGQIDTKEIFNEREERREQVLSGGIMFLRWLSAAGETLPPWWSPARDTALRAFVKSSDHISGAVYTLRDMMTAIPVKVLAKDPSIKAHLRQANDLTEMLMGRTESRGNTASLGWGQGYGAFIQDYHETDNGAFMAIEGPGRPDGPLTGAPLKLIHLDSSRCQRTGHREYPVIYADSDGKRFKLHHTRVIAMASMASPIADMYGVGFCAVSRCINIAQNLMDIARYKQEKLGSRPWRGMIVAENASKSEVQTIANYLELAGEELDNRGQSRYAGLPVVGSKGPLSLLDFSSLPDGFDELESTQLAVAVMALAFGVDMRQFAFAFGVSGQTRADAEVQHAKMRGKGPGAVIQEVKRQFGAKVLPPHLYLDFDYQDDEQDEQQARIRKTRAETREKDIGSEAISLRVAREQMVEAGDLSEAQFIDLELKDGRLEDGSPIESLFFVSDRDIQALLSGIDPDTPDMAQVEERLKVAYAQVHNAPTANLKDKARLAVALLEKLKGDTQEAEEEAQRLEEARAVMEAGQFQTPPPLLPEEKSLKQLENVPDEINEYEEELSELIEQAQTGELDRDEFESKVEDLTAALLAYLFALGADQDGSELDESGKTALQAQINLALEGIPQLAEDVFGGAFIPTDEGGKGNSLPARVALWAGVAAGIYELGKLYVKDDPYYRWDRSGLKQSCADCIRLDGQIHKASEWKESGWTPRAHNLACHGYRCGCTLVRTNGPGKGDF